MAVWRCLRSSGPHTPSLHSQGRSGCRANFFTAVLAIIRQVVAAVTGSSAGAGEASCMSCWTAGSRWVYPTLSTSVRNIATTKQKMLSELMAGFWKTKSQRTIRTNGTHFRPCAASGCPMRWRRLGASGASGRAPRASSGSAGSACECDSSRGPGAAVLMRAQTRARRWLFHLAISTPPLLTLHPHGKIHYAREQPSPTSIQFFARGPPPMPPAPQAPTRPRG